MSRNYPDHAYTSRRAFLKVKRADGKRLLKALAQMRNGCAYLPPSENHNAGTLMCDLEKWIKGPCRKAWRNA